MTILQSAARAGINHVYNRRDIHFIRDNPRLTLQVEELRAAAHAVPGMLTDRRIKVDVDFLPGVGPVAGFQSFLIHDIASVVFIFQAKHSPRRGG